MAIMNRSNSRPCCKRGWRALAAIAAMSILALADAGAAEPKVDKFLSGFGWEASLDGVTGWIPVYSPFPNPVTMPNKFLDRDGIHADLMWYWAGPGAPGPGSGPKEAYFRYKFKLNVKHQVVALVAADDYMELKVNGVVPPLDGEYRLADHIQANGQPAAVAVDLGVLKVGDTEADENIIEIHAKDTGIYHWVFFDAYNNDRPFDALVPFTPLLSSLIGDKDDFHAGDTPDVTPKSDHVLAVIDYYARTPGLSGGVDLDVPALNNAVGLTHYFTLPAGALITSATVNAKIRITGDAPRTEFIFYNDSQTPAAPGENSTNVIALDDLLGHVPRIGETYDIKMNLAKLPLRAQGTGNFSGAPDSFANLLPMLKAQSHLDLVFADDTMVDFSELRISFTLPGKPAGDLNGDNAIDRDDVEIIMAGLNTQAYGANDPRDLDHDGRITVLDVRKLVASCTTVRCVK